MFTSPSRFLDPLLATAIHLLLTPGDRESSDSESEPNKQQPTARPSRVLRVPYTIKPGGPRAGSLSVNDPQLNDREVPRLNLSEGFFELPPPIAPRSGPGASRFRRKDPIVLVHRLLRKLMAAHDYGGAARALAVLHRLHGMFDPDVYRYTVALLRLSGDDTVRESAAERSRLIVRNRSSESGRCRGLVRMNQAGDVLPENASCTCVRPHC